ncbi:hypothetical protein MMAG44476_25034 [Mycolicibacterium mageritense DSM 44476 = CIP 104973]|uniref:PASTA domain-containing protein n=1 Tax=Mycolicibacterium mageritense TaxID=53462 RepID=A0AAI8U1F5_MYCME|nr:hypothetical protein [Mycolicibacterium mageritense]MBN3458620.1 hypothetical protein [Mycobacterium sp. DSM 3803]OKH73617.1 hypothetical protein EB73_06920 [Mycobacterium sp. SWH-M3]TXI64228.1 MAG: hypothetical protein E6Q55_06665 [Mycolicibacterium mageritense]CDO25912.1 hypothetical protein BN978_06459 [Mycolicibacterium mageritense DSM 44476 = CIP 104973]BBX37421.1 hypothetical protein MMAGJ_67030 [Mycolicibacterium mageritense]
MKKLVVLAGGLIAAGSAAVLGAGVATSQPDVSSFNVVGEPYVKAVAILKSQGVKATFGGSRGSVLPQAQCLVDSQKVNSSGKMILMLDCTQEAADRLAEQGPSGGPTVGSNGVTTVTPTPVVPVPGAPGAGTPPPAG